MAVTPDNKYRRALPMEQRFQSRKRRCHAGWRHWGTGSGKPRNAAVRLWR